MFGGGLLDGQGGCRIGDGAFPVAGDELDPDHQSESADVTDSVERCGGAPDSVDQLLPAYPGVLDEAFVVDDVEGGDGGCRGDRIAAVGTTLRTRPCLAHHLGGSGDRRDREAGGESLGGDEDVGDEAVGVLLDDLLIDGRQVEGLEAGDIALDATDGGVHLASGAEDVDSETVSAAAAVREIEVAALVVLVLALGRHEGGQHLLEELGVLKWGHVDLAEVAGHPVVG